MAKLPLVAKAFQYLSYAFCGAGVIFIHWGAFTADVLLSAHGIVLAMLGAFLLGVSAKVLGICQ